jgi:ribose transport system substrate-binding protein
LEQPILKQSVFLRRGALGLVAALFALLLFTACGSLSEQRYFLVAPDLRAPYWQTARAGFNEAANELGVKARIAGPHRYDPQEQAEEFQRVVKLRPDGILVSAADAELLRPHIDAAIDAGIPVITIDSDAPASKRLLYIGTNNHRAGLMGGEAAARHMRGKGNVAVFTVAGQNNLAERLRGYQEAFARHPGIKIVEVVDTKGDPRVAFDKTLEIVAANGKIDAYICLDEFSANEVAEVLDRAHVKGKTILAMEAEESTLNWIRKGVITATIAEKPYQMGYQGLKKLVELRQERGRAPASAEAASPTHIETRALLVDKDNIEEFSREVDRSPGM